ncbi:CoA-transferase family III domain-containing protein [Melampsora americana]|nr:CoA-transferase family III domain-containing protein [Melampsora americana]
MFSKIKRTSSITSFPQLPLSSSNLIQSRNLNQSSSIIRSPLKKIKVLDCSRILAGPYAAQMLGDMGAEVIKIEEIKKGDDTRWLKTLQESNQSNFQSNSTLSNYFISCNRNKKSLTLNLKHPNGIEIFKKLIQDSDVLIENFMVGKMEELGIGYEVLKKINPNLIYSNISGFGSTGPLSTLPGYDVIAAAQSGLMSITGEPDRSPMKIGVALSDLITGIYTAYGILLSLYHRDVNQNGKGGQKVESSLFESSLSVLANVGSSYLNSNENGQRWGTQHPSIVPYQAFETSDSYMIVGTTNDRQFQKLCDVLDLPTLKTNPLYSTNSSRVTNRSRLIEIINQQLKTQSTTDWLKKFKTSGLPHSKINSIKEGFDEVQSLDRKMILEIDCKMSKTGKIKLIGIPIKLSNTPGQIQFSPPELGEHNEEILRRLGYDLERIHQFKKDGII